jgi:hypothetical protein
MSSDFKETESVSETSEATEPPSSGTGLSDAGVQAMQGPPELDASGKASSAEVDAIRQQQQAEAKTGAVVSDGKVGFTSPEAGLEMQEVQTVGNPKHDAQFWHEQQNDDTCAVVAQEGIIQKHTGQDLGENTLQQEAIENGWYRPGEGTRWSDVGNLLESHDVPTNRWSGADMNTLCGELEQGRDVIAGVDVGYLWRDPGAIGEGHAVWVTGLETDQGGNTTGVFLNDSGNPEIGGGGKVSAEVFKRAWNEAGSPMVSTQDSAPV